MSVTVKRGSTTVISNQTYTTGSDGSFTVSNLELGDVVTVTETSAPTGYYKPKGIAATKTYTVIDTTDTQSVTFSDTPIFDPVGIVKVSTTGIAGTDGEYTSYSQLSGHSPVREWTFATNENGYAEYSDDTKYYVSGDTIYKTPNGLASLPPGTTFIEETKAPEDYRISPHKDGYRTHDMPQRS